MKAPNSGGSTQGLGRAKPTQIMKKEGFGPPNSKGSTFFAGVVTLTELAGSTVATNEANDATASVEFVASVKI